MKPLNTIIEEMYADSIHEGMFDVEDMAAQGLEEAKIAACFDSETRIDISDDLETAIVDSDASYPGTVLTDPTALNKTPVKKLDCRCRLEIQPKNNSVSLDNIVIDFTKCLHVGPTQGLFMMSSRVNFKNVKIIGQQTIRCNSRFYADGCEFIGKKGPQNKVRFMDFRVHQFKNCKIDTDLLYIGEISKYSALSNRLQDFIDMYRKSSGPLSEVRPKLQEYYKNLSLSDLIGTNDVNKWNVEVVELRPAESKSGPMSSSVCFFKPNWWNKVKDVFKEYPIKTKDGWYILYGLDPYSYME